MGEKQQEEQQQQQESASSVKKGRRDVDVLTTTQLHKMTVKDLREKCKQNGLEETGIKPELVKRLREHYGI